MADRPVITTVPSGGVYNTTTLNSNFIALRDAVDTFLGTAGTSGANNTMSGDLDMGGYHIRNAVFEGFDDLEAIRDDAIAAQEAAENAQEAAEDAQVGAEIAQGLAEDARDEALAVLPTVHVDNIDALRLVDTFAPVVNVLGYYTPNDGGGGYFWRDESDTISVDDGGTIIVSNSNIRWKRVTEWLSPEMFGAKGDGTTDDSAAFVTMMNAFPDRMGFTCYLGAKTYRISSAALYFTRRIKLIGVSRTVTTLDFSDCDTVVNAPYNCHIITVHSNNINTGGNPDRISLPVGQVGTYGEMSGLQDLTVKCNPNIVDGIGVFFNVSCDARNIVVHQANLHCIVVAGTADSFLTRGGTVGPSGFNIRGNSNNGVYYNIKATGAINGDGIHVAGSNANANLFDHADANTCKGWGINDTSSLGNTYIQAHTNANAYGAYRTRPASTNRSTFICPYAEGNQGSDNPSGLFWEMNNRALIFGADGVTADNHGNIRAVSAENAGFVFRTQLNVMDAANTADVGGAYSRVGKGFFEMKSTDGHKIELKRLSSSYTALYHDSNIVMSFRNADYEAIRANRPHLENGISLSLWHGQTAASAMPSSGDYQAGNVIWNDAATAGGTAGWVCTTGGTAGSTAVFKTFGTIEV